MLGRPLAATFLFAALWATAGSARAEISLAVGLYPTEQPRAMVQDLRPALDFMEEYLEAELGEEVEIRTQIVKGYREAIDAILSNQVDFARLGGASYVLCKTEDPDVNILAMENHNGSVQFNGVIVVRADSAIENVSQLRGRTFAFVSDSSALGRYFPQAYLLNAQIRSRDLKDFAYLGRHEEVGRAVSAGRYDAGALSQRMYERLVERGMKLRAIAHFENVSRAWVARSGLEPRVRAALQKAFLQLHDPKILQTLGFDGFVPGSDTYYDETRRVIADSTAFFAD